MMQKIFAVLILASAISLVFPLPQPLQLIAGFLQAFVVPGLVLVMAAARGVSRADRILFALLLSPIMLAILAAAGGFLFGDLFLSARIILAVLSLLCAVLLFLGRAREEQPGAVRIPRATVIVSLVYGGLVLASYLANRYLLITSDSWYHAAVVREVAERGIPPGEPLLADFPIRYMWFYHVFEALWIRLSGLALFPALGSFNVINACIWPFMIARFVSCLTDNRRAIIFATLLTVAGLDAATWIFWPIELIRAFTGDVTGLAEVRRIVAQVEIGGRGVIHFLAPLGSWNINFSDKFLTITIMNYSFNLFLLAAVLALGKDFLSRFGPRVVLFTIILGVFLFHVVAGILLLATVIGACVLLYLVRRARLGEGMGARDCARMLIPALLVVPIAAVYFVSLTGSGGARAEGGSLSRYFQFGYRNLLTIVFPLIILFVPARKALRSLVSGGTRKTRLLLGWIVTLLAMNLFVNIGTVGEKKLIYYLFLLMGPPIYIQLHGMIAKRSGARRYAMIAAVLVLFAVPPALTFRGFIMERPEDEIWTRRYCITDEDRRYFDWIEHHTSRDAVIVANNIYHLEPVYAGRRNFYSWYYVVRSLYKGGGVDAYGDIQTALFGQGELGGDVVDAMGRIGKKLYVAVWKEDLEAGPWLAGRFASDSSVFETAYSSRLVSLYVLRDDAPITH